MKTAKKLTLLLFAALVSAGASAQTNPDDADSTTVEVRKGKHHHKMHREMSSTETMPPPVRKWYMGNTFDGAIFSTAVFERPGLRRELTPIRFSLIGLGYNFNYDFDEHFGMFTGVGIKNIGFIEKIGDSTVKRRAYTIGLPLGFKLGNLSKRHFGFIGGGIDWQFNYREKGFVNRRDKAKFSEWFSQRTADYMPYLFAGFSYGKGSILKVQYYPGNFFNPDFEESKNGTTIHPYRGYSAHLLYITLGMDIHFKPKAKATEAPEAEAETM